MQKVETTNLEELLNRLKQEGVDQAQMQGDEIIEEAQAKANRIVNDANKKAAAYEAEAGQRIQSEEEASLQKLEQSARDLMIGLEAELKQKIAQLTQGIIGKSLDPQLMQQALLEIAKGIPKGSGVVKVTLDSKQADTLGTHFVEELAANLKEEVALGQQRGLGEGFYIERDGEDYFYDFSAKHLAKELSKMAFPRLKSILNQISNSEES